MPTTSHVVDTSNPPEHFTLRVTNMWSGKSPTMIGCGVGIFQRRKAGDVWLGQQTKLIFTPNPDHRPLLYISSAPSHCSSGIASLTDHHRPFHQPLHQHRHDLPSDFRYLSISIFASMWLPPRSISVIAVAISISCVLFGLFFFYDSLYMVSMTGFRHQHFRVVRFTRLAVLGLVYNYPSYLPRWVWCFSSKVSLRLFTHTLRLEYFWYILSDLIPRHLYPLVFIFSFFPSLHCGHIITLVCLSTVFCASSLPHVHLIYTRSHLKR